MNLPSLLLCGLAAFQCRCTNGAQLDQSVTVGIKLTSLHTPFGIHSEHVRCPWAADPRTLLTVECRPSSFKEYLTPYSPFLIQRLKAECGRLDINLEISVDRMERAISLVSKHLITDIRHDIWELLFSAGDDGRFRPPTSTEMKAILEMRDDIYRTISNEVGVDPKYVGEAFDWFMAKSLFPIIEYWRNDDASKCFSQLCDSLYQGSLTRYFTKLRFIELAARVGKPSEFFFGTFHPQLVVCHDFEFNCQEMNLFEAFLLSKSPLSDSETEFLGPLRICSSPVDTRNNSDCWVGFYFRDTDQDGLTTWNLVQNIRWPLAIDKRGSLSLSLRQMRVELQHVISKATGCGTVQYSPKDSAQGASYPSETLFDRVVLTRIFVLCLESEPRARIDMVCKWTRSVFPDLLSGSEDRLLRTFRDIMIPSGNLVQFVLASLITIVSRPGRAHGSDDVAAKKLCLCVAKHFPLLLDDLVATLREYVERRELPHEFSKSSGDELFNSGLLTRVISYLGPQNLQGMA